MEDETRGGEQDAGNYISTCNNGYVQLIHSCILVHLFCFYYGYIVQFIARIFSSEIND